MHLLRLHTLGRLSLASGDTNRVGSASRRRSLALLALAASSGDAGIEDENALALLWPEFDSQRARNNLKQVCFSLRQGLGPDAFVRDGTTLRIDPAKLSVDLWDFQRAATKGTPEAAVELYTGPFLNGFNLPGLTDFERWAESERSRIAQLNVSALETLASTALASADHHSAVRWWRQLVMQNQFNDVYSQNLIKSLVAAGDIGGALQHVRVHESLLQQELDVRPSSEFQQFVHELRRVYAAAHGTIVVHHATATNEPSLLTTAERKARDSAALPAASLALVTADVGEPTRDSIQPTLPEKPKHADPEEPRELRASHGKRLFRIGHSNWVAAVVVLVVAVAGFASFADRPVAPAAVGVTTAVVVLPFAQDGGSSASTMGATVTALLATSLDGSMGLRVLPAVKGGTAGSLRPQLPLSPGDASQLAAKAGASLYVTGQVVENGGRIRITAELRSRQSDSALELVAAEGDGRELFDLVDRVASQILASRVEGGRREVVRVASVTTSSLPAAKAYFAGEEAFRAGRFRTAVDSYSEALRLDSAFALAQYGLSGAAEMLGDEELATRAASAAQRHASNLPRRQRRLLTAYLARQRGDVATADRVYSQLTADYPTDGDAWMGLAEARFHLNALRGRPAAEARDAFERATALDPTNASAFVHLARIATLENEGDKSRQMIARARAVAAADALERMALHVLSLGGPLMDAHPSERLAATSGSRAPTALQLLSRRGTDDWRAFASGFTSPSAPERVRAYGLRLASLVAASRGCIAESLALLDECSEANRSIALEARARLAVLAFIPFDSTEIRRLREQVNAWTPDDHPTDDPIDSLSHAIAHPSLRLHLLGLLSLRLNDTAAVEQLARELDAMANGPADGTAIRLAASLRAHLAASRGQPIQALALLEGAAAGRLASASSAEAYDRLLHAQLLEQTDREDEALGYYREFGEYSPFDLPLIWQAELGMARIYASQGDRLLAARYYRSVANRLKDADLPLRGSAHAAALRAADMQTR